MFKKLTALTLVVVLAFCMFPAPAFATDTVTIHLSNSMVSGTGYTVQGSYVFLTGGYNYIIKGTTSAYGLGVLATCNITLEGVNVDASSVGFAFALADGGYTVNLTLLNNNTLKSKAQEAGIDVPAGSALNITAASTGSLTVYGGEKAAGIGGHNNGSGGTITIAGGTVYAYGGNYGAGIGGGYYGTGGSITITGGTVIANAGAGAAGIGGGYYGSGGTIAITGGSVTAISSGTSTMASSAGIGGGVAGAGGTITITGGTITATANHGAGIGGGFCGAAGTITITGGTITATSQIGAGIGGGPYGDGGTVAISGGSVTGVSSHGAGVGSGYEGHRVAIIITGGTVYTSAESAASQPDDIGNGGSENVGSNWDSTLEISGTAAVFVKHDIYPQSNTNTHPHRTINSVTGGKAYGVSVPLDWTPPFGAFLSLYSVDYYPNGGTGTIALFRQHIGTTGTLSSGSGFTRASYSFTGWNTLPNGSGTAYAAGGQFTFTASVTLYAQWSASTCTVTFDSQGGSGVSNTTANYNTTITAPAAPTRAGYTFGGWYREANCATAWNFGSDKVTSNMTLYAKWIPITCTVTFDSQGGSGVSNTTANYNTTITAPAAPTRAGYTFGGWYREANCATAWNFATDKVTANITLYAKWNISSLAIPASPKAASSSYNSIKVSWNAVSNAGGYEVWRAASSTGVYTKVGTTASNSFTNTGLTTGTTYYYKVRAYRTSGATTIYSGYSAIASNKPVPATPPSVKATQASYNSIKVTWGAVTGASMYEVHRATSSAGTYTLLASTTALSCTNASVSTGTTYYYKVRAYRLVGSTKVYGAYSSIVSTKTILAAPSSVKATPVSYNSIKLTWGAVAGATKYELYRSTSSMGTYSLIASTSYAYYTNISVNTGTAYYYKARAYRLVGSTKVYSGYSTIVSAKATLAAPTSAKAVRVSSTRIKVSWGAVAGATKYEVWRSMSSTGAYTLIASTGSVYYTNTGLTTGKYYYYKVRAYRLVGTTKVYSGFSTVVYAKP